MKDILVLVHEDPGQGARLRAACDLVRLVDGHLVCLDVLEMPPVIVAGSGDLSATALVLDNQRDRQRLNRGSVETQLRNAGVEYSWIEKTGYLAPSLCDAAGLADLLVINRDLEQGAFDMFAVAGEVVVNAGRPVLAVPETAQGFAGRGHALVAWDGSREADQALRAAVPLLRLATRVTLVEVRDGSLQRPATAAKMYLEHHAISSTICHETAKVAIPSVVILKTIPAIGADYLVMGGYGHSRFVEAVLGGVTKRMLHVCPIPVLFAH